MNEQTKVIMRSSRKMKPVNKGYALTCRGKAGKDASNTPEGRKLYIEVDGRCSSPGFEVPHFLE